MKQRLVFDRQFGFEIRLAQSLLDPGVEQHLALVFRGEQDGAAAMVLFAEIKRVIGPLIKVVAVHGVGGETGEADRRRNAGMDVGETQRRANGGAEFVAKPENVAFVELAAHENGEFVAAETRDRGRAAGETLQPDGAFPENAIADRMSVKIVDRLEAVEVDDAHDEAAAISLLADRPVETLEELAPVRQARQAVGIGQAPVLLGELHRPDARRHHRFEIAGGHHHHIGEKQADQSQIERDDRRFMPA